MRILALLVALGAAAVASADGTGGYELRAVARGLTGPVLVTHAPGEAGTLYVVERRGLVRVLVRGRLRANPFLDLRSSVSTAGERGLLPLAFPPDYRSSRRAYVQYTDRAGDVVVAELNVDGGEAAPARALVRVPHGDSLCSASTCR